ncbi:MAG TPA: hypothetical protein VGG33_18565, partial [Polyangia bacterium]
MRTLVRPLRDRLLASTFFASFAVAGSATAPALAQPTPAPTLPATAPAAVPETAPSNQAARPADTTPSQALSLKQALEQAVQGNVDLRRERIAIEVVDAQLESARGFFDVNVTTNGTFSRTRRPSLGAQDIQAGSTDRSQLDFGIARNLETGGSLSLGLGATRSETNSPLACGMLVMSNEACNVYDTRVSL